MEVEPLLNKAEEERLVLFPIKHDDIFEMYKKAVASFWVPEEIDLSQDSYDWIKLTDNEQHFLKHVLAFFSSSDTIVNINLTERFMNEVTVLEARYFYAFQVAVENIHSETYSILIDQYVKDTNEKTQLFEAVQNFPSIAKKAEWCFKHIHDMETPYAQRLIAFAIVEGVFFSGAFCSIFYFKERGLLPGLGFSNELISRDESLHVEFAVLLYSKIVNRVPEKTVVEMFKDAVDVECDFINNSLPCSLLGMNADLMTTYIQFVADRLLIQLGYSAVFGKSNPFQFMERISLENRTNFFEGRVGSYAKANVALKKDLVNDIYKFDMNSDF